MKARTHHDGAYLNYQESQACSMRRGRARKNLANITTALALVMCVVAVSDLNAQSSNWGHHIESYLSGQYVANARPPSEGRSFQYALRYSIKGPEPGSDPERGLAGGTPAISFWLEYDGVYPYATDHVVVDGVSYNLDDIPAEIINQVEAQSITLALTVHAGTQNWETEVDFLVSSFGWGNRRTWDLRLFAGLAHSSELADLFYAAMAEGSLRLSTVGVANVRWNRLDAVRSELRRQEREAEQAAAVREDEDRGTDNQNSEAGRPSGNDGVAGSPSATGGSIVPSPSSAIRRSTPSPPSSPQIDYRQQLDDFVSEEFRRQAAAIGAVENFFDEIADMQRSTQRQRRWDAAASLETSGQSPEALIRQVEQKKRELERLAEERREEHRRSMERIQAEADRTIEEAQTSEGALLGAAAGLAALGGQVIGDISIQNQRRRAQEDLERQLTDEFEKIQQQILADIDRSVDTAERGKAQTLFPEEFAYFEAVIRYYESYRSEVDTSFTIDHTEWMYPQSQQPRAPQLSARPDYTADSATELMENKWSVLEGDSPHKNEARESLDFLTAYAMDLFSERPEPFYYRSLLVEDALDRYLLSRRAAELGRRDPYRGKARRDFGTLTDSFFSALEGNNRSTIQRVWNVGLLPEMRHSSGDGAYLFALRKNVDSLDYLLSLHDRADRGELAQRLLTLAASEGVVAGVSVLVDRGADENGRDGDTGMTPMLAAASNGHLGVVSTLEGDYRVSPRSALDDANRRGFRSARYYLALYLVQRSVTRDDPLILGNALRYEPEVVNAAYRNGTSYLGYAVAEERTRFLAEARETNIDPNAIDPSGKGMLAVAMDHAAENGLFRLLVDWGASLATPGPGGRTALHWAVEESRQELVSYLLEQNPPINQQDNAGRTPLMAAIAAGNSGVIRGIMSRRLDYALQDNDGRAALHYAVQHLGSEEFSAVLDATGTVDIPDTTGNTPMHVALVSAAVLKAQALLSRDPSIDLQNDDGESYLHVAARSAPEMIEPLLGQGASVNLTDRSGNTALHISISANQTPTVIRLLGHGADPALHNQNGDAPVHAAIKQTSSAWLSLMRPSTVEVPDGDGNSPIHLIINSGWGAAASLIGAYGVAPNWSNLAGQTYLHVAAERGDRLSASALIAAGANLNAQDESGNTPLHYAALANALEVVTVLLEAGADASLSNAEGRTARDLAIAEEHEETAAFIRAYGRQPGFFKRLVGDES